MVFGWACLTKGTWALLRSSYHAYRYCLGPYRKHRGHLKKSATCDEPLVAAVEKAERIEAAVEAGGIHVDAPHEAWIWRIRSAVTGPHGFERTVVCALDDTPAVISERVRETLDE